MLDFVIFYLTAATFIGAIIASMRKVEMTFAGRPLKHPRLFGFFFCGLFWPWVLFRMVFPASD